MGFRIGIDAHAAERDGTGNCTYIRNLLLELASIDRENRYFIYAINPMHPFYDRIKIYKNYVIKSLFFKNPLFRIPLSLVIRAFLDKIDLLHVQYIAPPLHSGKLVVTIHDLAHFDIPWSFSRFEVLRSRLLIPLSAKKAKKILTGSAYSSYCIREKFRLPDSKLVITPYGVNPILFKLEKGKLTRSAEELKRKYGIKAPYILSLSRLNFRKNLTLLIKAFEILKNEKNMPHQLVIAGIKDVGSEEVRKIAEKSLYYNDIIFTGYVPDEDLAYLYGSAEVFVFLSEYEGFGLPVLEAMACGVPVVTYASTSLPEVAKDAALYVSELNPLSVAEKIRQLFEDADLHLYLKQKGKERAKLFTWEETAKLTLKVYNEILHGKN
ncbi:MAG: glycosyltransferase family 4 protein [Candidatus Aminicenantes bacterium]|nr:glycosyltransferase family 4 protein [Candidatus Aminicenantes bacterium]